FLRCTIGSPPFSCRFGDPLTSCRTHPPFPFRCSRFRCSHNHLLKLTDLNADAFSDLCHLGVDVIALMLQPHQGRIKDVTVYSFTTWHAEDYTPPRSNC